MGFDFFKFPAGEVHCKTSRKDPLLQCLEGPDSMEMVYIPLEGNLNDHLMKVLLVTNTQKRKFGKQTLFLPYLPYSRQDRPTSEDEPFSLEVIGDILNLQEYSKVYTLDAHSDVAYGCVNNLVNIGPEWVIRAAESIRSTNQSFKEKILVIPDQGAYKRLSKLTHLFKDHVITIKKRNEATGHLVIKEVVGDVDDQDCLIVDDICDGGMTFTLLAKELFDRGAKSVELVVSHGIFSKGLQPLIQAGISRIYTTDSFHYDPSYTTEDDYKCLSVISCEDLLLQSNGLRAR
jgi:ribose-phosphate pyrophosphokinase